jgi:alkylhydroperoxidase family enzyme
MPLLREVPLDEIKNEKVREWFKFIFGDRDPVAEPGTPTGTSGNWWTVFANSPDVLLNSAEFIGIGASDKRAITPRHKELGVLRQAWLNGCKFMYSQHCKLARSVGGMTQEEVSAVSYWQVSDLFSPVERALLALTDAIVSEHGRIDPKVIEVLRENLTNEAILEFAYITALYMAHGTIVKAFRLEYDDMDDPMVEVPAPEGAQLGHSATPPPSRL